MYLVPLTSINTPLVQIDIPADLLLSAYYNFLSRTETYCKNFLLHYFIGSDRCIKLKHCSFQNLIQLFSNFAFENRYPNNPNYPKQKHT